MSRLEALYPPVASSHLACYRPATTAVRPPGFITPIEYLAGEEISDTKHEYLDGTVHALAGATLQHNDIAGNCFAFLHGQLRGKPCQPYNSDTKVRIVFPNCNRFYCPDAMVVCQSNSRTDHFQNRPVVIIEVLSDSTRRTDIGEKCAAYLTIPSHKVLLFVEPDTAPVTLHRRQPEGEFGIEAVIPLPEIEASLSLADVYERVEFTPPSNE